MPLAPDARSPHALLRLLAIPLIDGYFISMVLAGSVNRPAGAVMVGLVAFSGAGVFSAVSLLPSSRSRVARVAWAYLQLLPLACAATILATALHSMEFQHQAIFTTLILLSTAVQYFPSPWFNRIRQAYPPGTIMGVLLAAMALSGLSSGALWHIRIAASLALLAGTGTAVAAGMAATLLFAMLGTVLQIAWDAPLTRHSFAWVGSAVLFLVAMHVLGDWIPIRTILTTEAILLAAALGVSARWPAKSLRKH